jgi:hypothetical protein
MSARVNSGYAHPSQGRCLGRVQALCVEVAGTFVTIDLLSESLIVLVDRNRASVHIWPLRGHTGIGAAGPVRMELDPRGVLRSVFTVARVLCAI